MQLSDSNQNFGEKKQDMCYCYKTEMAIIPMKKKKLVEFPTADKDLIGL